MHLAPATPAPPNGASPSTAVTEIPQTHTASVIVHTPIGVRFDYWVPADIEPGTWVEVPFGRSNKTGLVDEVHATPSNRATRPIHRVLPLPGATEDFRRFISFAARYTLGAPGALLRSGLPPARALNPPKDRSKKAEPAPARRATLTDAQVAAAQQLRQSVSARLFTSILLDGVTGSGKTEVYLEAVEEALSAGRQVLILMPEIALTRQTADRIAQRLGIAPVEWHSRLTEGPKARAWRAIASGDARLIIGARSAIFLPLADLGLIVVDEEHDSSFRQDATGERADRVPHSARDLAVARAKTASVPVILASATPSLESWLNARAGRYQRVALPTRHGGAGMPTVEVVDMREQSILPGTLLSGPMIDGIKDALAADGQALLFLNRRGYASGLRCVACGEEPQCHRCSARLVEHRHGNLLACHHCNDTRAIPTECPACASPDLKKHRSGVERLAEEVQTLFPEEKVLTLSSDLVDTPDKAANLLDGFREKKYRIACATQIVAKGHDFADLIFVGVVEADAWASADDPRANERNYAVLHQVGGRAGRREKTGRVMLQTYAPGSRVVQALVAGDRDGFLEAEAAQRSERGWAPFASEASLILSAGSREDADEAFRRFRAHAPRVEEVEIIPNPEPRLWLLRGRFRRRFLVRAPKNIRLQPIIAGWIKAVGRLPADAMVVADIDPTNFD